MKRIISLSFVLLAVYSATLPAATRPAPADYVENQIIVKFRKPVTDTLEMKLAEDVSASGLKLSGSLDKLNKIYRLKEARPLFKNFKKNRQRVGALLKKDKALLTKKEKRILRRLKRARKNATVPALDRIYKIDLDLEQGQSLEDVVAAYNDDPDVEYAELNYIVSICKTPNDPLYPIQWPLNNTGQMYPESGRYNAPPGTVDCDIDAPEAWDIHTGSSEVIIAVVDTGVDYTHRDLDDNMWVNEAELNGTAGIDDDGNGYIDDIYGYDFCNNDGDPMDDHYHGTHCGGIIAAEGDDGLDIAGICWDAKVMALKFLSSGGSGWTSDAVAAFYYAVENGADVTSNSWGGGGYSQSMEDAINYAYSQGVIMVASAGNDNSTSPHYPAYYDHMFSVAATNSNDEKASFSNYGDWVDIAAPGVDVLSLRADGTSGGTVYDDYTTIASGTSMACPHVAGACALLLSIFPVIQVDELEQSLTQAADPIAPEICQSGRLNLYESMLGIAKPQGIVRMQSDAYSCASNIEILLTDSDLLGNATQEVTVTTSGGDLETVILTETPAGIGVFSGTILTDSGAANTEDGVVQISHGQVITVIYEDANNGTGSPDTAIDTAVADCESPVIFNVQVEIHGVEAKIIFETNEPTTALVRCGLVCGGPYSFERFDETLSTTHNFRTIGLTAENDYYFIVETTDAVGNKTVDDNSGACYSFTTSVPLVLRVPAEFATIQAAIDEAWGWSGETVLVADGTYRGDGNRDIEVNGKSITVRSENGPESTIIDCEGGPVSEHRGFYFHNNAEANSILSGFTIINGYTTWDKGEGGGIYCQGGRLTISNCNISNNNTYSAGHGSLGGSAIYCNWGSAIISNCTITGNTASGGGRGGSGGGISVTDGIYLINNCTISGNSAENGNGGIFCGWESNTTITNCILWNGGDEILNYGSIIKVGYSNVQGGWPGEGNIDVEPGFAFPGDYHIMSDSPCIDAGTNTPAGGLPARDIDGNPRVLDGDGDGNTIADIGAYEYNPQIPSIAVSAVSFSYVKAESNPGPQSLLIRNCGGGTLNWEIIEDCEWLQAEPTNGISAGNINEVMLTVDPSGLEPGLYSCVLQVCDASAANSPRTVKAALHVFGEVVYVPSQFSTIQQAIDHVLEGGEVIIADGIYRGDGNRDIKIGGKSITVRSENGPENCIIDCQSQGRGFYFHNGEDANSVLDGFTITNGYLVVICGGGAGISVGSHTSPTIRNCIIANNRVELDPDSLCVCQGGGIHIGRDSSPTIINCIIKGNSVGRWGAGGGISCYDDEDSKPRIINCVIKENTAVESPSLGGGIYGCRGLITNCTIVGNSAVGGGGLVWCGGPIENCIIIGNTANGGDGGGLTECGGSITNCTIAGNSSLYYGGGMFNYNTDPILTNCILWGNTAPSGSQIYNDGTGSATVSYSDVQGGWPGLSNIDADPQFVDPCNGDYHLRPESLCIDTGDPCYSAEPNETDLDGNPRVTGGRIDMGAYEANYIQARLRVFPEVINRHSKLKRIMAWIHFPRDITKDQIDNDQPVLLYYPGAAEPIEPIRQYVFQHGRGSHKRTYVLAYYDKAELMTAVPGNGPVDLEVIGRLKTGQYFYGSDTVRIIGRRWRRWWRR